MCGSHYTAPIGLSSVIGSTLIAVFCFMPMEAHLNASQSESEHLEHLPTLLSYRVQGERSPGENLFPVELQQQWRRGRHDNIEASGRCLYTRCTDGASLHRTPFILLYRWDHPHFVSIVRVEKHQRTDDKNLMLCTWVVVTVIAVQCCVLATSERKQRKVLLMWA